MKRILIFIVMIQVSLFATINTTRLDSVFNSIGKTRVGLSENDISSLQTPFIGVITKQEKQGTTFKSYNLYAVFGKLAKINENNEERVLKFKEGKSDVKIEIK